MKNAQKTMARALPQQGGATIHHPPFYHLMNEIGLTSGFNLEWLFDRIEGSGDLA